MQDNIFGLFYQFKARMLKALSDTGASIAPMHVKSLHIINRTSPCTAQDIALTMGRDKAQVTRLVNDLINRSLVCKQPNPRDKRSQFITLTPSGVEMVKVMGKVQKEIMLFMQKDIAKEDLEAFNRVAELMTENLKSEQSSFSERENIG
jgi:DNA-binding MarR family transcriptional regulator